MIVHSGGEAERGLSLEEEGQFVPAHQIVAEIGSDGETSGGCGCPAFIVVVVKYIACGIEFFQIVIAKRKADADLHFVVELVAKGGVEDEGVGDVGGDSVRLGFVEVEVISATVVVEADGTADDELSVGRKSEGGEGKGKEYFLHCVVFFCCEHYTLVSFAVWRVLVCPTCEV